MGGNQAEGDVPRVEEEPNARPKENRGLTTAMALEILHRDIGRVLDEYEDECRKNKYGAQLAGKHLFNLFIYFCI